MSILSILEWVAYCITLLIGLWFAIGIRLTAAHHAAPPTWPTLIFSFYLFAFPAIFLLVPFSKLHIIWLVALTWPLSIKAGMSYIPFISKLLIWPAYFYARILMVGTGRMLSSPNEKSPWTFHKPNL
jgi:hypothetical protein